MNDPEAEPWVLECESGDQLGVSVPTFPHGGDARIILNVVDIDAALNAAASLTAVEAVSLADRLSHAAGDLVALSSQADSPSRATPT